ncbi:hypothetical protein F5Y03DRAFT_404833 [Xylaria venustula]|nr:hypothetical protein F5Y03DRAFT_404833 [Xylaria venustula]
MPPTPNANETDGSVHANYDLIGATIPVTEIGCWDEKVTKTGLNWDNFVEASKGLVLWGYTHRIGWGSYKGFEHGVEAVWICNCKHFMKDHVVQAELDDAARRVKIQCGGTGGWVWSKPWQKSFNCRSTTLVAVQSFKIIFRFLRSVTISTPHLPVLTIPFLIM